MHFLFPQVSNNNVSWREFLCHWPLWSIYIAHFSMNWSNYIIMQWLPTYMTRTLGAEKSHIMFTAVPYIMNSLVGMGERLFFLFRLPEVDFKSLILQKTSKNLLLSLKQTPVFQICIFCEILSGKNAIGNYLFVMCFVTLFLEKLP